MLQRSELLPLYNHGSTRVSKAMHASALPAPSAPRAPRAAGDPRAPRPPAAPVRRSLRRHRTARRRPGLRLPAQTPDCARGRSAQSPPSSTARCWRSRISFLPRRRRPFALRASRSSRPGRSIRGEEADHSNGRNGVASTAAAWTPTVPAPMRCTIPAATSGAAKELTQTPVFLGELILWGYLSRRKITGPDIARKK
jgi:hypothetical protein